MRLFAVVSLFVGAMIVTAAPLTAQGLGNPDDGEELVQVYSVLSATATPPGETVQAAVIFDVAYGWHINSARPYQDYLIAADVVVGEVDGLTVTAPEFPAGNDARLADELMSVYDGRVVIPFRVTLADDLDDGQVVLPVSVSYQPCNDRECRAPETVERPLTIQVGAGGERINDSFFAVATVKAAAEPAPTETGAEGESLLEQYVRDYGFWGYFMILGSAFVLGLLLSFSPCTYPMIPITVSIFAGQERTVGRGFFLSLVYVGTMALIYGVMGLVVSLVGGVFGAWLAEPAVVIGIVVVFVIFSLSMFGLYELNVPSSLRQKLGTTKTGGGVIGSIVLGVVAALVVSPCVGPFVAGILLYIATNGSPVIGFLTLFVFAMGLGTLFIVIGTFSSAINRMPRSGEWMETVKKFFGFVLLLMAIYFLRPLVAPEVTAMITALLLIAFGVFGGGLDRLTYESGFFLRLKKYLGILALLAGAYLFLGSLLTQGFMLPAASHLMSAGGIAQQTEETGITGWETDLEAGLIRARESGRPVVIDTWATWCANCRVLEKQVFQNPEVGLAAERFVPIKVQLERADSPETLAFKERFGLKTYTLPTTLLLDSEGNVKKIIAGVVTPQDFITELNRVH